MCVCVCVQVSENMSVVFAEHTFISGHLDVCLFVCLFVSQRFTGNQIAKIYQQRETNPEYKGYHCTEVHVYR